jgi:plasmid stability protein
MAPAGMVRASPFWRYTLPMTTKVDLPADLLEEIQQRAAREGRKLDETMTDLLRQALAEPMVPSAARAMLDERRRIAEKFISGEWGTELTGFEAARAADRERAGTRDGTWRR